MATFKAFKGIRPAPEYAKAVAALPYDVMSSDEAREMVKGNPHSFLHVDKAEIDLDPAIDLYDDRVYAKAKENFEKMQADGVLISDDKPLYYIYELTMNGRSQTGLVGCAAIDEYLNGTIKKHELTRVDKEQDRIRHVETLNANTGPIFLAYRNQADIQSIMTQWKGTHAPVYDFVAEDGIAHKVWVMDDAKALAALAQGFEQVPCMYIADGHHRNASAVKVGLKRREENPSFAPDAEFNFYLAVAFPDEELYIMDYNRLVKDLNGLTPESFLETISANFEVSPAEMATPKALHTFSMYLQGQWYTLAAKSHIISADSVEGLDVSLLQNHLLAPVLGIGDPRTDKRIDFVGGIRGLGALKDRVDSGEMAVAFALYPTSMAELMAVADEDRLMPPKSTWFEPKLRSGLLIHTLS